MGKKVLWKLHKKHSLAVLSDYPNALKTLEIMERERSWEQITSLELYEKKVEINIKKYGINIDIYGLPSISSFKFLHPDNNKFKTLTQEFLKRLSSGDKFLFINCTY